MGQVVIDGDEMYSLGLEIGTSKSRQFLDILQRHIQAERDRCYRHATAPDYGELTPEAKAEASRIAERIKDGT